MCSPDEGDVTPPLEKVLAVVGGEIPVVHLLDVRTGCKCLRIEVTSHSITWSNLCVIIIYISCFFYIFMNRFSQVKT